MLEMQKSSLVNVTKNKSTIFFVYKVFFAICGLLI